MRPTQKRQGEDVRRRIAVTIPDLAASIGCGLASADKIARESGAVFYIGKRKFASVHKVEQYIGDLAGGTRS